MTFRLTCPVCGKRDVYEFTYGGPERGPRPPEAEGDAAAEAHFRWVQFRMNRPEAREEWWYHGAGCGVWFSTWRNPATNREEPR
ncbi:sarcosine oxidase subunit delta [Candidatus Palauibacter sp.]|uniref:sarcosine oxidase subunit delta n=1 Tax=Candidatus Palauibacter sp. TaxID=3101350 RepID=UPI003B028BB9